MAVGAYHYCYSTAPNRLISSSTSLGWSFGTSPRLAFSACTIFRMVSTTSGLASGMGNCATLYSKKNFRSFALLFDSDPFDATEGCYLFKLRVSCDYGRFFP